MGRLPLSVRRPRAPDFRSRRAIKTNQQALRFLLDGLRDENTPAPDDR